jgi:hypothetical protein
MDPQQDFPVPTSIGGRLFFDRHDVEQYKRRLIGLTLLDRDPAAPIVFVTAQQISEELQIDRRTLGRRIRGRVRGEEMPRSAKPPAKPLFAHRAMELAQSETLKHVMRRAGRPRQPFS